MIAAALALARLVATLTAISLAAVGLSVALVTTVRSAEATAEKGDRAAELGRRVMERRAVEAVIWGTPT